MLDDAMLREPSEYDSLVDRVRPFLGDTTVADLQGKDVDRLARGAEVDPLRVATLIAAGRLARDGSLPDWLFYSLGRQGVPLQLQAMAFFRTQTLREAVGAAIEANIVSPSSREEAPASALERLRSVLIRAAFDEPRNRGRFSFGALLGTSLVSRDMQEAFLARYLARPESPEEFWKSLEEDDRFSRDAISDFRLTLLLGRLTGYRLPLLEQLKRLRQQGELDSLRDLVRFDRARWREMLRDAALAGDLDFGEYVRGETEEDRLEHYITALRASIMSLFPSDSLRHALADAPDSDPRLWRFLADRENLELYWKDIDDYL